MNKQLFAKVGRYVKGLLTDPELVEHDIVLKRGRENDYIKDNSTNYITIDTNGSEVTLAKNDLYDGENELMNVYVRKRVPVIVSFYGDDAYEISEDFEILQKTDKAKWLARDNGVEIYQVSSALDIKRITGQEYINRLDITFNVIYNKSKTINVKRVETIQCDLLFNN